VASMWWRSRVKADARVAAAEQARLEQEATVKRQAEFFATMSHELRTPLVAVRTFASEIAEAPDAHADARRNASQIEREAIDLLSIITNILDAAKLDAGKMDLLLEPVSLRDVIDRCVVRCKPLFAGKDVELLVDVPEDLPRVRGDFVKLQQVVTNLVSNAAKFTDAGAVTVRARAREDEVILEVEDTGVGIEEGAFEDIWQPFRQADSTTTRRHGGTGLGLSIVRGLVERHGASVDVRSKLGEGSTFRVVLKTSYS
jgi:signal transduction histidine kinase